MSLVKWNPGTEIRVVAKQPTGHCVRVNFRQEIESGHLTGNNPGEWA